MHLKKTKEIHKYIEHLAKPETNRNKPNLLGKYTSKGKTQLRPSISNSGGLSI